MVDFVVMHCVPSSLVHPIVAALNLNECSLYIRNIFVDLNNTVEYKANARCSFETSCTHYYSFLTVLVGPPASFFSVTILVYLRHKDKLGVHGVW